MFSFIQGRRRSAKYFLNIFISHDLHQSLAHIVWFPPASIILFNILHSDQSVRAIRNNVYLQEAEEECIDGDSVNREAGVGDVIRAEYDEQDGKNVEMDLQSRVIERNRKAD